MVSVSPDVDREGITFALLRLAVVGDRRAPPARASRPNAFFATGANASAPRTRPPLGQYELGTEDRAPQFAKPGLSRSGIAFVPAPSLSRRALRRRRSTPNTPAPACAMPRAQQSRRARRDDCIARTMRKPARASRRRKRRAAAFPRPETPGSPRQQHCRLAITRFGSSSRGSGRLLPAEGVARPHGCWRGIGVAARAAGGRLLCGQSARPPRDRRSTKAVTSAAGALRLLDASWGHDGGVAAVSVERQCC